MLNVYYMEISPFEKKEVFEAAIAQIEEERRDWILRTHSPMAGVRSLAAGTLLRRAVCEALFDGRDDIPPLKLGRSEHGKPFLLQYPELHFNLSHSGRYVLCGVGEEALGVDIQEQLPKKDRVAERFFTPEEICRLQAVEGEERERLFFRMWSIKESYIKLTGKGLSTGLDQFEILWDSHQICAKKKPCAFFEEFSGIPGYSAGLCTVHRQTVSWQEMWMNG